MPHDLKGAVFLAPHVLSVAWVVASRATLLAIATALRSLGLAAAVHSRPAQSPASDGPLWDRIDVAVAASSAGESSTRLDRVVAPDELGLEEADLAHDLAVEVALA